MTNAKTAAHWRSVANDYRRRVADARTRGLPPGYTVESIQIWERDAAAADALAAKWEAEPEVG